MRQQPLVLSLEDIQQQHYTIVGGKAYSLGRLLGERLREQGVIVPRGIVLTTVASELFFDQNTVEMKVSGGVTRSIRLRDAIAEKLASIDIRKITDLRQKADEIRSWCYEGKLPVTVHATIVQYYQELQERFGKNVLLAVRSSATTEDLEEASFAGQFDTFLCVRTLGELLRHIKDCFAGLYNFRAISYRKKQNFPEGKVLPAVVIQRMVRSDNPRCGASGVMFSVDPESMNEKVVFIESSYGFGEYVVQGEVNPDRFVVVKEPLRNGKKSPRPLVIGAEIGTKAKKLVYNADGDSEELTKSQPVPEKKQRQFSITEQDATELARLCTVIEQEYGHPVDVEWAKDENGLRILQARPIAFHRKKLTMAVFSLQKKGPVLCTGQSVGLRIGSGKAQVILDVKDIERFEKGNVLITEKTDPDWEPIMSIASAIVTRSGGRTCHAAIISREQEIPCIVGAEDVFHAVKDGTAVTIDCSTGNGIVYQGLLPFDKREIPVSKIPRTKTKISMNIGFPEMAFQQAQIPNDGVGLARIEFIISGIGIHPRALIDYAELKKRARTDEVVRAVVERIAEKTHLYANKVDYYIDQLASGVAKIATAFWPRPVIVRFSDFKTNEYRELLGGFLYEPEEENPMIGWRGASRYYHPNFIKAFQLEVRALKKVREQFGLTNVIPMVPFCRTVTEAKKVIATIKKFGLSHDIKHNATCERSIEQCPHLRLYMMCEIPANIELADQFLDLFDGYSIGSNDLTQLYLGLDRDAGALSYIGNELNDAVKQSIGRVIGVCRERKKYIGICGQGPSDYPEFLRFLIDRGIENVSLIPDTVLPAIVMVAKHEKKIKK